MIFCSQDNGDLFPFLLRTIETHCLLSQKAQNQPNLLEDVAHNVLRTCLEIPVGNKYMRTYKRESV